jgi:hypothetical protein
MDAWQRSFGYTRIYDEATAIMGMIVDSEPIRFEYGGKAWLIEFWKGQYDLTTGGEIGVYATEGPVLIIPGLIDSTFYEPITDSELLQMSYMMKKKGKTLFTREDKHWWLTGFKLGEFSKPSQLMMMINITIEDEGMLNAFLKGLNNAGYSNNDLEIYENSVSFKFDKPHSKQPLTRTMLTDWLIQLKNKYLCNKYQRLTGNINSLDDKVKYVQEKAPKMFEKISDIGSTKKLFSRGEKVRRVAGKIL